VNPTPVDPWQAQRRHEWGNRLAALRAAPGQPVFHALLLLALAAVLLPALVGELHDPVGPLAVAVARWPWVVLGAVLLACAWQQLVAHRRAQHERMHGWLSAQPVQPQARRGHARRAAVRVAVLQVVVLVALAATVALPRGVALGLLVMPVAALAIEWLRSPGLAPEGSVWIRRDRTVVRRGVGRVWRWQLAQAQDVLGPRRASLMVTVLVVLALLPMNAGLALLLATLAAALTLLLLCGAWLRSVMVLADAHRWLQAQPIRARRLLGRWLRVPLAILAIALVTTGLALVVVGAARLWLPIALLLVAFASLHLGAVASERGRPRRIPVAVSLQWLVFLGVLQAFPPAAAPVWLLQMAWLARRSLRP
jgi:hypothetical protein